MSTDTTSAPSAPAMAPAPEPSTKTTSRKPRVPPTTTHAINPAWLEERFRRLKVNELFVKPLALLLAEPVGLEFNSRMSDEKLRKLLRKHADRLMPK